MRPHGEASHRANGEKKCSSWRDVLDGGIILYPRGVTLFFPHSHWQLPCLLVVSLGLRILYILYKWNYTKYKLSGLAFFYLTMFSRFIHVKPFLPNSILLPPSLTVSGQGPGWAIHSKVRAVRSTQTTGPLRPQELQGLGFEETQWEAWSQQQVLGQVLTSLPAAHPSQSHPTCFVLYTCCCFVKDKMKSTYLITA